MNPLVFAVLAVLVSGVAALTDVKSGRIPNALTVPALGAGLLLRAATGAGAALDGCSGCVLTAALPFCIHRGSRGRAIGGGDVKLFAALGAITGPGFGLRIELSAFVLLAGFAVVRLVLRRRLLRVLANAAYLAVSPLLPPRWRRPVHPEGLTEMRLGPAIALGALLVTAAERLPQWVPWPA